MYRGTSKKKSRTTKATTQESIVPFNDEAPASSMYFPPSQCAEPQTKQKGKSKDSGGSIR